jgi:hypothetical protein
MAALALRGQHRAPIPDLMLAAIAQASAAVVLHYDADFERIAGVTGQPHEWIVPRGDRAWGQPLLGAWPRRLPPGRRPSALPATRPATGTS